MIKRLAEATFDCVKFTFAVMFVAAFLFTVISLSYTRPTVAAGIVIGAIVTKVLSSIILWALSKTEEMKNATVNVIVLLLIIEVAVIFLPIAVLSDIKAKLLHKGPLV